MNLGRIGEGGRTGKSFTSFPSTFSLSSVVRISSTRIFDSGGHYHGGLVMRLKEDRDRVNVLECVQRGS